MGGCKIDIKVKKRIEDINKYNKFKNKLIELNNNDETLKIYTKVDGKYIDGEGKINGKYDFYQCLETKNKKAVKEFLGKLNLQEDEILEFRTRLHFYVKFIGECKVKNINNNIINLYCLDDEKYYSYSINSLYAKNDILVEFKEEGR